MHHSSLCCANPTKRFLIASATVLLIANLAAAATFSVSSTADETDSSPGDGVCASASLACTLRAAVQEANALAGADEIMLPSGTYALILVGEDDLSAVGDLDIRSDVVLTGAGADTTTIDATAVERALDVMTPSGQTAVTVSGVTLSSGTSTYAQAIRAESPSLDLLFELGRIIGFDRTAVRAGVGSSVTFQDSEFDGTSTAIDIASSLGDTSLTVTGCDITADRGIDNSLAGPPALDFAVTVSDTVITNHSPTGVGGPAITMRGQYGANATLLVERTVMDRTQGIQFSCFADAGECGAEIRDLAVRDAGSGVTFGNQASSTAALTVEGSELEGRYNTGLTVTGNSSATVANTTFSGYSTGVQTFGSPSVSLDNVTITDSSQRAINGVVTMGNSIAANSGASDCFGTIHSTGFNLIESTSGCTVTGDTTGNIVGLDPLLDLLADNGGPTRTHALLPGSPAVDAGSTLYPGVGSGACADRDQTGAERPTDGDADGWAVCDMGAYENPGDAVALDFGDAPLPFATVLADDGARHVAGSPLYLGMLVDAEPDGIPHALALGDDADGLDDEDGVEFTSALAPGASADVEVTASAEGTLSAWIDFNRDFDWDDPDETLFGGPVAVVAGTNPLSFAVPADAVTGDYLYARFRLSASGGLAVAGPAGDGEVEDYAVIASGLGEADLVITKTGPTHVMNGDDLDYAVVASNPAGPDDAVGATVSDVFPPELAGCAWACSGSGGGTCSSSSGSGDLLESVDLPAGGMVTFDVVCSLVGSPASVTNSASVDPPADVADPISGNNTDSATTSVQPYGDLVVAISDGAPFTVPPSVLTYTVEAFNPGPGDAAGAEVTTDFPGQLANVEWTCVGSGGGSCAPSGTGDISEPVDLPAGATVTFTATAEVAATPPDEILTTTGLAPGADFGDPVLGNNADFDHTYVSVPGTVLEEGFESGDLSGWSAVVGGS